MPAWSLPSVVEQPKEKQARLSTDTKKAGGSAASGNAGLRDEAKGAFESMFGEVAFDENGDTLEMIMATLVELLRQGRENRAACMDFVLLDAESPEGLARAKTNRDYAKAIKTHKELQAKNKKDGKPEEPHSYGSPFLHQYLSLISNAKNYFETEKEVAVDGSSKLKGIIQELERLDKLEPRAAERGIRMCQVQEAHKGTSKLKLWIKVDMSQTVEDDQWFMQDLILEFLEKSQAGVVSTTPAPPGRKEREFRKRLSKQRAAGARHRR